MRPSTKKKLSELDTVESPKDVAWGSLIDNYGVECAGWLLREHRKSIRLTGAIEFKIPKKQAHKTPMWFAIAIRKISRLEKWDVEVREDKLFKRYLIKRTPRIEASA